MKEGQPQTKQEVPQSVNHLIDQVRVAWEQLPDEQKAIKIIELLENVIVEDKRQAFRETLDKHWPVNSNSIHATFALITITQEDLEEIGLIEDEAKFFDAEKLRELSMDIRDHYVNQGFFEELKYHTNHFLGGIRGNADVYRR